MILKCESCIESWIFLTFFDWLLFIIGPRPLKERVYLLPTKVCIICIICMFYKIAQLHACQFSSRRVSNWRDNYTSSFSRICLGETDLLWMQTMLYTAFYECKQCCIPLYMTPSSEIHYIKPDCTRLQKDPPGPEVIKLFLYSYSDEFSLLGVCTSLSMTQKTEVIKVLSWTWNTCIITYGVARDCFKKRTNLDTF